MSKPPTGEPTESGNGETLETFVNRLITRLNNNQFFNSLFLHIKFIETSLKERLLKNLTIVIDDELVSQFLVTHLLTDEPNKHKALLYLLIMSTPENLELFLKQKSLRQVIITILRENNYNLILKLPKIYENLDLLIDYEVFSQIELDSLLNFNNPNQEILKIIANSDPENLNFFVPRIFSSPYLRKLIYNQYFQYLLALATPANLKLLSDLIVKLLTQTNPSERDFEEINKDEKILELVVLLAIQANNDNLKILKDLEFLTEETLKAWSDNNNLVYFTMYANPFNLELLQQKRLLDPPTLGFLIIQSKDLLIYSNPDVLKLLLDHQIINKQNLKKYFNDETIQSALLQYGKPENFAILIDKGLINAENFGRLVKLPAFYYLVLASTENLRTFFRERSLTPKKLEDLLKNSKLSFDDPPEMIMEYTNPDIYLEILSRLPKSPSNQN